MKKNVWITAMGLIKKKWMNNQMNIIDEKLPKVSMMKSPAVSGPTPCQRSAAKEIDLFSFFFLFENLVVVVFLYIRKNKAKHFPA